MTKIFIIYSCLLSCTQEGVFPASSFRWNARGGCWLSPCPGNPVTLDPWQEQEYRPEVSRLMSLTSSEGCPTVRQGHGCLPAEYRKQRQWSWGTCALLDSTANSLCGKGKCAMPQCSVNSGRRTSYVQSPSVYSKHTLRQGHVCLASKYSKHRLCGKGTCVVCLRAQQTQTVRQGHVYLASVYSKHRL